MNASRDDMRDGSYPCLIHCWNGKFGFTKQGFQVCVLFGNPYFTSKTDTKKFGFC